MFNIKSPNKFKKQIEAALFEKASRVINSKVINEGKNHISAVDTHTFKLARV